MKPDSTLGKSVTWNTEGLRHSHPAHSCGTCHEYVIETYYKIDLDQDLNTGPALSSALNTTTILPNYCNSKHS